MSCACGSNQNFEVCCKPFIHGKKHPETAEQLMRSRYTAYTMNRLDYIQKTMTGPALDTFLSESDKPPTNPVWIGLEICDCRQGEKGDLSGTVRFKATYLCNGEIHCLHEKSEFLKINEKWAYTDGNEWD
jgi:SEC-C motif domain protein